MGFKRIDETPAELWERYQDQFPVREHVIYLNHAAVAPLCRPAAEAMANFADDCLRFGLVHYEQWLAAYDGVRRAAARLIQCAPSEIAIVKNTSEGIATVALGFDWNPGDKIVCFHEEFPANRHPWVQLGQKGVWVEWLSVLDPLEKIDRASKDARLLAISFVQYLSGYRAPLQAIGEICRANDCFFFVDAIQGLGAFPLDVAECHIDALAADGHKWLLGPEGCGILYVSQSRQDRIRPTEFGWSNMTGYDHVGSPGTDLRPDAGRYECGSLNTIGCYGLRAAIEFLLEVGPGKIAPVIQNSANRIAEGVQAKGYEVLGSRSPDTGAGIVSFRKAGRDSSRIVRDLRTEGIIAAPRQGWIRTSPHFYISRSDVDRLLDALPA